jgi:hypothetical protein
MEHLSTSFDPDTVALMGRICEEVWNDLQSRPAFVAPKGFDLREPMAMRIMAGITAGERDPDQLRKLAMVGIDD